MFIFYVARAPSALCAEYTSVLSITRSQGDYSVCVCVCVCVCVFAVNVLYVCSPVSVCVEVWKKEEEGDEEVVEVCADALEMI